MTTEFEIYLQCPHRPKLTATAHHVIARSEQVAEASLRAAGARALVALIDGFALHRLAWPRGKADQRAPGNGIRALIRSYLTSDQ
ncbi:MAG: hypothetical protein CBARDCOR_4994 [uncultured Caballeronia sp.]|nr:MAG: hypothetical protein CBARDCOR_4994 [uncultured Caballeronia sp.]